MGKHKRTILIVDLKFQLKIAALTTGLVLITAIIFFVVIEGLWDNLLNIVQELGIPQNNYNKLHQQRDVLFKMLVTYQAIVCLIIFSSCVLFTHRIAGPLYKLKQYLSNFRHNTPPDRLAFRKGDYFHEIAFEINKTFKQISEDYQKDFVYVSEINTYLKNLGMVLPEDKKIVVAEISKKLAEIQNRFNDKGSN